MPSSRACAASRAARLPPKRSASQPACRPAWPVVATAGAPGVVACAPLSDPRVASARITSRVYDPVVEVPVDSASVLRSASTPAWTYCPSPTSIRGTASPPGAAKPAENGEAPDAVPSVAAIVAAAPLAAKPCTASRMPVANGEVRMS